MAPALGPPSSNVSSTLAGFGLPHPDTADPVTGVCGAVVAGFGVLVGLGVAAGFGVVFGVVLGLGVVLGDGFGLAFVVVGDAGGTAVTVRVGGTEVTVRVDGAGDVTVPVGSSSALTVRVRPASS